MTDSRVFQMLNRRDGVRFFPRSYHPWKGPKAGKGRLRGSIALMSNFLPPKIVPRRMESW